MNRIDQLEDELRTLRRQNEALRFEVEGLRRADPARGPPPVAEDLGLFGRAAGFGVWSWEAEGRRVVWSDEMYDLFGVDRTFVLDEVSADTLLTEDCARQHRDATNQAIARALARATETGAVSSVATPRMKLRPRTPAGPRWVEAIAVAVASPDGLLRTWGVLMDVSEAEDARRSIEERDNRLRAIFDSAQDGILVTRDRTILDANEACARLLGRDRDELVGRSLEPLLAPGHLERFTEALGRGEESHRVDRFQLPSGEIVELEATSRSTRDRGGPVQVSYLRDLRAERERSRLLAAIEHSSEAIVLLDAGGVILYANSAAEEMTRSELQARGTPPPRGGMVGRRLGEVFPADLKTVPLIEDRVAVGENWTQRLRSEHADGTVRAVEIRLSPVSGGLVGGPSFVLFARDLSREDALERQLEQAERLKALGTLAGGIAHDFNNILNGVLGFTEVGLDLVPPEHRARPPLEQILAGISRARDLVRRISTFGAQVEPSFRPIDLGAVVEEALGFLRATLPPTVTLVFERPPEAVGVSADPGQVHQVLVNLGTNAYQAPGTTRVEVEVSAEAAPDDSGSSADARWGRLQVRDDGAGMSADVRRRMFEPFFTTKPGSGSGMGLAVVHGIVESHRGRVEVDSREGRGTRITVLLPGAEPPPPTTDLPAPSAGAPRPALDVRVLLVDDEPIVLDVAQRHLEGRGAAVDAYTDPVEALAAFASSPQSYDIVLTDLGMPDLGGDDLARRIRSFRPDLPIVLLTGVLAHVDDAERSIYAGLVAKPFSRAELLDAVRAALDERPRA